MGQWHKGRRSSSTCALCQLSHLGGAASNKNAVSKNDAVNEDDSDKEVDISCLSGISLYMLNRKKTQKKQMVMLDEDEDTSVEDAIPLVK